MPATFTHAIFAVDVFEEMAIENKNLIKENVKQYTMFAQSMDSMMFYNIVSLKPGKKLRNFQHTFHTSNTNNFFIHLINYIRDNKLYNNSQVMSFLYGFLCHYVLDSNVHPYVFYKTGSFDKNDAKTYKYNNLHSFMETYIDNYMIKKKEFVNPYSYKIHEFCFDLKEFDEDLKKCLNITFKEVFKIYNMADIYYLSLKQMKSFLKNYRYDRWGIKMMGYKFINRLTPRNTFRFDALSYHYDTKFSEYFLNSKHNIWYNPCDEKIFSYESFDDLYSKSIREVLAIINNLNEYFKNKNVDLNKILKNKSYVSGLDCDKKLILKKFYF